MKCEVIILLEASRTGAPAAVVKALKAAGLEGARHLKELNMVTGNVEEDAIAALKKIGGVASIERSTEIQLPPPESDLQ